MSESVSGSINGVVLKFDQRRDFEAVRVEENMKVNITLQFPSEWERPTLLIDNIRQAPTRVEDQRVEWDWLARDTAGYYEVRFESGEYSFSSGFRLVPTKVTMQQYQAMSSEVDQLASALRYDILNRGGWEATEFGSSGARDLVTAFRRLAEISTRVVDLIYRVLRDPLVELERQSNFERLDQVTKVAADDWPRILHAVATAGLSGDNHVTRVMTTSFAEGHDNHENRFVKGLVGTLVSRWTGFRSALTAELARSHRIKKLLQGTFQERTWEDNRAAEIRHMQQQARFHQNRLVQLSNRDWLSVIRAGDLSPTLRMMRAEPYRQLQLLSRELMVTESTVTVMPPKPLARRGVKQIQDIYELWTYLSLPAILSLAGAYVSPVDRLLEHLQSPRLRLQLPVNATTVFLWERGEGRIVWRPLIKHINKGGDGYLSRSEDGDDPVTPDLLIELDHSDGRRESLILDAKYRVKPPDRGGGKHGPNDEDLVTALMYANTIVPRKGYSLTHSCILYPGEIVRHLGNIQALPLSPGNLVAVREFLESRL